MTKRMMASMLVAIAAMLALAAGAQAKPLVLKTAGGGELATGSELTALGPLTAQGGEYTVQCSEEELTGTISKKTKGAVTSPFSGTRFSGCTLSGGLASEPFGITVRSAQLPWTLHATGSGKATLKGTKQVEYIAEGNNGAFGFSCGYEGKKFKGTTEVESASGYVFVSFQNQPLTSSSTNDGTCPQIGGTSSRLQLFSGGEPVEAG